MKRYSYIIYCINLFIVSGCWGICRSRRRIFLLRIWHLRRTPDDYLYDSCLKSICISSNVLFLVSGTLLYTYNTNRPSNTTKMRNTLEPIISCQSKSKIQILNYLNYNLNISTKISEVFSICFTHSMPPSWVPTLNNLDYKDSWPILFSWPQYVRQDFSKWSVT